MLSLIVLTKVFYFLWNVEAFVERNGKPPVLAVVDLSEWSKPLENYYCCYYCWVRIYWSGLMFDCSLYKDVNAAYLKNYPVLLARLVLLGGKSSP